MFQQEFSAKILRIHNEINLLSLKIAAHLDVMSENSGNLYIDKIRKSNLCLAKEAKKVQVFIQSDSKEPLSTLRHDLINPVSGMKGYAEIMLETNVDSQLTMKTNELIEIINDLLKVINRIDVKDDQ